MRRAAITSSALYVPEREITNDELRQRFERRTKGTAVVIDKFEAVSGIMRRFAAPEQWATSDLALPAARQAIRRAGLEVGDIDLVIVATDSPDAITPSTSVVLQHKLGAKKAGTFDVSCACASFPTALATAAGLIATNASLRRVLIVGAYLMRKLADPDDVMSFYYGDGAGAVVVEASDEPGVLGIALRADGAFASYWGIASGGTLEPASEDSVRAGRTRVRMLQKYPPEVNEDGWPLLVHRLADENHFSVHDINLALFTQVRKTTIENVMQRLELPIERAPMIMDRFGYTGSACIPMALEHSVAVGRARAGDLVVMVGSGVGYNQAALALRITPSLLANR
jgi:3-oxoacyl-[acyl-carrier-protein] synthase-3